MISINHASVLIRKERLSLTSKASQNEFREIGGSQTESKALEKSIVEKIVQEPDLGLLNPSEMD